MGGGKKKGTKSAKAHQTLKKKEALDGKRGSENYNH